LVLEEIPGWIYVGDTAWQRIALANVEEMVMRDRNHPSVISYGVRINESFDYHDLYEKTNRLARTLDLIPRGRRTACAWPSGGTRRVSFSKIYGPRISSFRKANRRFCHGSLLNAWEPAAARYVPGTRSGSLSVRCAYSRECWIRSPQTNI
jgi:hypothetical protein